MKKILGNFELKLEVLRTPNALSRNSLWTRNYIISELHFLLINVYLKLPLLDS